MQLGCGQIMLNTDHRYQKLNMKFHLSLIYDIFRPDYKHPSPNDATSKHDNECYPLIEIDVMGKQTFAILSYTQATHTQTTAAWYVGRGERRRAHLQVNETTTKKKDRAQNLCQSFEWKMFQPGLSET